VWIVAGYSGENDPVFEHLAKTERYDNGLYWICYKDNPPKAHVQEKLLVDGKDCFCVQGFDADDFFVALAQGLGFFPPDFVRTPFTHLENLLQPVLPYSLPGNNSSLEAIPKKFLRDAIEKIEKPGALVLRAWDLLLTGNFNAVIEMEKELATASPDDLGDAISWAYVSAGNELVSKAQTQNGEEATPFWKLANEKYDTALKIKPDHPVALHNWGLSLYYQACTKNGPQADRLCALANKKYEAALKIKPDFHEALYNWGLSLDDQARRRSGDEADRLWVLAGKKYDAALKIKPHLHDALNNWGNALDAQARTKGGREGDQLWALAGKKFEAALKIKPDKHESLYSWGVALFAQAITKKDQEADRLFALAGDKFEAAVKIKPDDHKTLHAWGLALGAQARTKSPKQAKPLFELANEKIAAARTLAPELYPVQAETPEVVSRKHSTVKRKKKQKLASTKSSR
jgi:Tfp pilus assembly protein PilF